MQVLEGVTLMPDELATAEVLAACTDHVHHLMTMELVLGGRIITLESLPANLAKLLREFGKDHSEYSSPDGADMACRNARAQLIAWLGGGHRVAIELGEMEHEVVEFGPVRIDFTARQIWPCANFPLIAAWCQF